MLNRLLKKVKNKFYNRKHHTNIASFRADLSAKYGIGVLIGRDTVVGRTVTIGDYSYVNSNSSVENCDIGKFCSISSGVYINPAEHEISGKEKEDQLLQSDVFIQTSRTEGMPMGIIEAMSYGLPCIVTKGTSLGEIISEGDSGWVAETNAESVAKAILQCIAEREYWTQKSENALSLVKNKFGWEKVAKETLSIYEKVQ